MQQQGRRSIFRMGGGGGGGGKSTKTFKFFGALGKIENCMLI